MTYTGHVKQGVVVFDGPQKPAEGAEVRVEEVARSADKEHQQKSGPVGEGLERLAGKAVGLPADAALNHDHYLYGMPKK